MLKFRSNCSKLKQKRQTVFIRKWKEMFATNLNGKIFESKMHNKFSHQELNKTDTERTENNSAQNLAKPPLKSVTKTNTIVIR